MTNVILRHGDDRYDEDEDDDDNYDQDGESSANPSSPLPRSSSCISLGLVFNTKNY